MRQSLRDRLCFFFELFMPKTIYPKTKRSNKYLSNQWLNKKKGNFFVWGSRTIAFNNPQMCYTNKSVAAKLFFFVLALVRKSNIYIHVVYVVLGFKKKSSLRLQRCDNNTHQKTHTHFQRLNFTFHFSPNQIERQHYYYIHKRVAIFSCAFSSLRIYSVRAVFQMLPVVVLIPPRTLLCVITMSYMRGTHFVFVRSTFLPFVTLLYTLFSTRNIFSMRRFFSF